MLPFENLMIQCIKSRELIPSPHIGLKSIFEHNNVGIYLKLCAERIMKAKRIGKDIIPDLLDEYNLLMTYEGLDDSRDILKSYLDEKEIDKIIEKLKKTEVQIDMINQQITSFLLLSRAELKLMKQKNFLGIEIAPEAADAFSRIATAELGARKLHNRISRKFVKGLMRIVIYLKCRKILNSVSLTQHID